MEQKYILPNLKYGYKELEPYMSELQLTLGPNSLRRSGILLIGMRLAKGSRRL